jgi:hypothetical protein
MLFDRRQTISDDYARQAQQFFRFGDLMFLGDNYQGSVMSSVHAIECARLSNEARLCGFDFLKGVDLVRGRMSTQCVSSEVEMALSKPISLLDALPGFVVPSKHYTREDALAVRRMAINELSLIGCSVSPEPTHPFADMVRPAPARRQDGPRLGPRLGLGA